MRAYLVVYFLLVIGAVVSLWQADILTHIPAFWLVVGLGLVFGLGGLLAVTSMRRIPKPE